MPVTSNQEFFGASVMEAIYCGVWPILPSRLSYPELIPIKYHSDNIYSSEDELYEKILFAIKNQEILQQSKLNAIPKQFDWKVIASEYDRRLKNIV
jgi:glycosyltransferase involved in cell wall biosynthesis